MIVVTGLRLDEAAVPPVKDLAIGEGAVVRVDDFRLPANWKTHFYFHSTRGTLSTASILRVGIDPASKLRCHIYAVFPVAAYRALGGQQVE